MEQGLQTHFIPDDIEKRRLISQRMGIRFVANFNRELLNHCQAVDRCFKRIFGEDHIKFQEDKSDDIHTTFEGDIREIDSEIAPLLSSIEKSDVEQNFDVEKLDSLKLFSEVASPFAEMLLANPKTC